MTNRADLGDEGEEFLASYRSLPRETPPVELDAAVMTAATAAVRRHRAGNRLHRWLRPLAFASVAALSIAVVLQVSVQPPAGPGGPQQERIRGESPATRTPFEEAGDSVAEQVRQAEEFVNAPINGGADAAIPEMTPAPPAASDNARCAEAEKASPGGWWRCIDALERAGKSAAAENELKRLLATFPQFVAPE